MSRRPAALFLLAAVLLLATAACSRVPAATGAFPLATVAEAFESARFAPDNVDSLAVSPEHGVVVATAKATDRLLVFDAASGALRRTVGSPGDGPGEFRRPNGIAIADDLLFVVERDGHRLQVLRLPKFEPLGWLGADSLRSPYGLAVTPANETGSYTVYVTDNYQTGDGAVPPAEQLGERVREFLVRDAGSRVEGTLVRSFGATSGDGVLHVVESIAVDPPNRRLLVADEEEKSIKVYGLDGQFAGTVLGRGAFAGDPEGIALVPCGAGGWWIATEQVKSRTVFRIFDRRTLAVIGAFVGGFVANTDGIAVTVRPLDRFPKGAMFAVHDDASVTAFSLADVERAVGTAIGRPDAPRR